ncbi:hypothetical protein BKA00_004460 [Actinomadura coerulea]|uniref:Uncharacterized protein n=1 Tax=Actinomadura coerulea TaxID=46159 RepID=A0A7X0L0G4_9ACTN|nr:hypothetical protein [Actinomadura coerulea]MBB6397546.1 hypothetical protein [Actinomadura coerulea]
MGGVLRGAAWAGLGTAAVAAGALVVVLIVTDPSPSILADDSLLPKPAPKSVALPANTPDQLALVRSCMVGDPLISVPDPSDPRSEAKVTGPGTHVADFRVLATSDRDSRGRTVLLGSRAAYRLCLLDRAGRPSSNDQSLHQAAKVWGVSLADVPDNVICDDTGGGTLDSAKPDAEPGWETHVSGRVPVRGGTRVIFTASDGRSAEAPVTDRFFVLRRTGTGLQGPELGQIGDVTVKLYKDHRVLKQFSTQMSTAVLH